MTPISGEDFQMFEQDVPGENSGGLSFQKPSALPLETCATINGVWGYSLTDTSYKTHQELIQLLVKSAGANANLLLNIGPMPNGEIQPEFTERLQWMGNWMRKYGESIYGTEGGYLVNQKWGVITQTKNKLYVHVLYKNDGNFILHHFPKKSIKKVYSLASNKPVKYSFEKGVLTINADLQPSSENPDRIIVVEFQ